MGMSPMYLPEYCVKCGNDARHGRRITKVLYFVPTWIYVGLFIGVLLVILLYYAARKPLGVSYSLCPDCARRQKNKKWMAAAAWLVFVVSLIAPIPVGAVSHLMLILALFVLALVASYRANPPLKVTGYRAFDQSFTLKGAGNNFLGVPARPAR